MKHIDYTFTESDVKTCIFSLSLLPLIHETTDDISDIQIDINEQNALSAKEKLINSKQLTANELRVLCCCIDMGDMICHGDIDVEPKIRKECMQYMFSFNKLDIELVSQVLDV